MRAHKMYVNLTAGHGVVVQIIDKEEREGGGQCEARHGYEGGQ